MCDWKELHVHIFVKVVVGEESNIPIAVPAVDQQQSLEESKLSNGVVGGSCCLRPFFPVNAHPNVSSLDHGYIIRPVSDCQCRAIVRPLYHINHLRFLPRRYLIGRQWPKRQRRWSRGEVGCAVVVRPVAAAAESWRGRLCGGIATGGGGGGVVERSVVRW